MIVDCNEIVQDRLWLGSFIRPEDMPVLRQMGITAIVSMQCDEDLSHLKIPLKKLLKAYSSAEIDFRRIPTQDFDQQSLLANLPVAVTELEKALFPRWARVYIHCTAGINRGPTLAAAYLIKAWDMSAQEAYDYVTTRRHCDPYLDILQKFEASLKCEQPDQRNQ
jgi:protein-tyrosine phosphatase